MQIRWHSSAWDDYLYWQTQDKKTLMRIHKLIKDIERNGNEGIGKPEPLKKNFSGYWRRHIDDVNSLVYCVNDELTTCEILACKGHYKR